MDGEDESLGLLCGQQCRLRGQQDNTGLLGVYRVVLLVNGWMWMFSECVWVNAPVLPKCIEAAAYFDFASGAPEMGRNIHLHSCPFWFIWPFAFEWRSCAWQWKYKSTCTFCISAIHIIDKNENQAMQCTAHCWVKLTFCLKNRNCQQLPATLSGRLPPYDALLSRLNCSPCHFAWFKWLFIIAYDLSITSISEA